MSVRDKAVLYLTGGVVRISGTGLISGGSVSVGADGSVPLSNEAGDILTGAGLFRPLELKQPVRVMATGNLTLATDLNAGDTVDGVTLVAGDRVLCAFQTAAEQNGIYVAGATPARAADMSDSDEVVGSVVQVLAGTVYSGTLWRVTNLTGPVIDTDDITFAEIRNLTALRSLSPAQIIADTDDWAPSGLEYAELIRLSTDASHNLTGILAPTTGRSLIIANVGTFDVVLVHDATSTAANRILCPDDTDVTLGPDAAVWLAYDLTSARWRVIGGTGGGGGGGEDLAATLLLGNAADGTSILGGTSDLTLAGGAGGSDDGSLLLEEAANGGDVVLNAGDSTAGGGININGGSGSAGTGGGVLIQGGSGAGGSGGPGSVAGGNAGAGQIGGPVWLTAGYGDNDSTNRKGAAISLAGGTTSAHGKVSVQSAGSTGTAGQVLVADGATEATWQHQKAGVEWIIDGQGNVLGTGYKGVLKIPFGWTITEWELESDISCNATMDVKKRAYGGGAAASITASAKPTLTNETEHKSSTLTGWTTTGSADEKLYFYVDTNDVATKLTLTLTMTRS